MPDGVAQRRNTHTSYNYFSKPSPVLTFYSLNQLRGTMTWRNNDQKYIQSEEKGVPDAPCALRLKSIVDVSPKTEYKSFIVVNLVRFFVY